MRQDDSTSELVSKGPCADCGSSDGLALYSDGHGFCFAGCPEKDKYKHAPYTGKDGVPRTPWPPVEKDSKGFPVQGESRALLKRGISNETTDKWGYHVGEYNGRPVQIANYRRDGALVAQKLRFPDKSFVFIGDAKNSGLYGEHLWRDGGKMVVVTEGEIDALSVSQLQGNKWPVVSLPTGAGGAKRALAKSIAWLEQFESVILMFDNDEPGNEAVAECAPLFSPGKCKVARLPLKDANEMLLAGRGKEVIDAIWGAKAYRPDGIVNGLDLIDEASADIPAGTPWCFPAMTEWTFGRRPGELYGFGAGTGVGKTDLFTQQIDYDLTVLKVKCGVIYLEQPNRETMRRIAGKHARKVFHVPGDYTAEEVRAVMQEVAGSGLLELYNHFGQSDWETIKQRIRYMVVALGCKHIYLDHLTALAAGEEDEKKALDNIMSELAGMCQELGCIVHYISHLATPEGKPHEEGGRVMIRHFRGSRAIGFWSHFMFGLERNQQAEDPAERSTSTLRCLKDRVTGRATGKTVGLAYDQETGMLTETAAPGSGDGFRDETRQPQGEF